MKSVVDVRYKFTYPEDYDLLGLSSHAGHYVSQEILDSHIKAHKELFALYQQQENQIKNLHNILNQEREAIIRANQTIEALKAQIRELKNGKA